MKSLTSTSFVFFASALYITIGAGFQYHEKLLVNTKTHSQGHHKINRRQSIEHRECYKSVVHGEFCNSGAFQDYASVFQRCNDSASANFFQAACTQNSMGKFCTEDTRLKEDIKNACNSSNSSCSSECRDLLITIRSELGCCIESLYNNSKVRIYDPISFAYSLWSTCGVEPVTQECPPSTITLPPAQVDPTCSSDSAVRFQLASSALCRLQLSH